MDSMGIKFHILDVVRKEYESKFGNREWDGMALNYYYFKKNHSRLSFLGLGGVETEKASLPKLESTITMAAINYMNI